MPFRPNKFPDRDRFNKFTERAKKVISLAQEEARRLGHTYIGTEHLLLGLIREGDGVAAKVLQELGVDLAQSRAAVEHIIGHKDQKVTGPIGMTPRAKKVIELAVDESKRLGHHFVGTEHLLLGIVREGEGIGAGVLEASGLTLDQVRVAVVRFLSRTGVPPADAATFTAVAASGPKNNVVTCRLDDRTLDAVDALVEAGIRPTRSDAAAWLIATGLEANRSLIDRVYATVTEIRRLRWEARTLAHEAAAEDSDAEPSSPDQAEPRADAPTEQEDDDTGPDDAPMQPA